MSLKRITLLLLPVFLGGCGDQYDRMTSHMISESYGAKGVMSLNTVAAPAVESYYLQRYGANAKQKRAAEEAAHRYLLEHSRGGVSSDNRPHESGKSLSTTRYIAIYVPRVATAKGASSVMVFDTQSRQIVGNNVYDLGTKPREKQMMKFDTYTTQYVGNGTTVQ